MTGRFDPRLWDEAIEGAGGAATHASFRRGLELVARAVLADSTPGRCWLDVGCGTGTLARHLAAGGIRVFGVDHDLAMLAFAAERSEQVLGWSAADVRHLPIADAACDGVAAVSLLGMFANPLPLLRECARVVRPGGRLLVTATHAASWSVWLGMLLAKLARANGAAEGGPSRYTLHRPAGLASQCRAAGLRPLRVTFYAHLPARRRWSAAAIARAEQREVTLTDFADRIDARNFLLEAVRPASA